MQIIPRARLTPGRWNAYCYQHSDAWFFHTEAWLNYQLAYRARNRDASFAVIDAGGIRALVPLMISRGADGASEFSYSNDPLPLACVADEAASDFAAREVERIGIEAGVTRGILASGPFGVTPRPPDISGVVTTAAHRIIDLTDSQPNLWRGVRRSYRSLIHAAERTCSITDDSSAEAFRRYRELHQRLAEIPRANETYDYQQQWLLDDRALLVLIERDAMLLGAAYWIIYKQAAYYASGAYTVPRDAESVTRRETVAHAAVWRSLLALRDHGVRRVDMGWQGRVRDTKGRAIEFFKRGWGGVDVPVILLDIAF